MKIALCAGAAALMMAAAGQALAQPFNEGPPSGHQILNLDGTAILNGGGYTEYDASFVATDASTNLSFAFREDPAFLFLDDVSVTTGGGPNLITNGGFEDGPLGASAPTGWTYLNTFGATFGGFVNDNNPHSGSNNYYDGAVQAYDGITQNFATVVGQTYNVSFWLADNSGAANYSALSTNGDITDTGGNGINLVVYAGGVPVGVPEPATWAMMILGMAGIGATLRRRVVATA
jgi:hypothetical protein